MIYNLGVEEVTDEWLAVVLDLGGVHNLHRRPDFSVFLSAIRRSV